MLGCLLNADSTIAEPIFAERQMPIRRLLIQSRRLPILTFAEQTVCWALFSDGFLAQQMSMTFAEQTIAEQTDAEHDLPEPEEALACENVKKYFLLQLYLAADFRR